MMAMKVNTSFTGFLSTFFLNRNLKKIQTPPLQLLHASAWAQEVNVSMIRLWCYSTKKDFFLSKGNSHLFRRKELKLIMVRTALVFCITAAFLFMLSADVFPFSGMVIRISGNRCIINKGGRDQVAPDQELFVHRIGKPVAKIKIVLVDSYSSEATITSLETDETVKIGDVVTTEPFSIAYTPPPPVAKEKESRTSSSKDNSGPYMDKLKEMTKIATFRSGPRGQVRVGIGEVSLLANACGLYGYGYSDPWMIVTVGSALLNQYTTSKMVGPHSTVSIAVTYYNDSLIDAQARYFASKEGITEESQIQEVKRGVVQMLGADTNEVFHVKIANQGGTVLQLAPFKWHMYLMNSQGQKVTSSRYEDALDRGVSAQSEAQGYIYFPKTDDSGRPVIIPGSLIRITIESILGGNGDLLWK
jgi:hypothetical protein